MIVSEDNHTFYIHFDKALNFKYFSVGVAKLSQHTLLTSFALLEPYFCIGGVAKIRFVCVCTQQERGKKACAKAVITMFELRT